MNMTITESDKKLLSFLAAFLILVLFVFLVFRPLSEKNTQLEREILTTKDQELAMDMAASLADEMVVKEQNTKNKMELVLQRFYPMLQSQEAENMMTVLMLNHKLQIQNLSVSMPDKKSDLKWYQYAKEKGINPEGTSETGGVYSVRVTCTAEGTKENVSALIDDISMHYPAISITATEWSKVEKVKEQAPVKVQVPIEEMTEDGQAEEVQKTVELPAIKETEQIDRVTLSVEIFMCEQ